MFGGLGAHCIFFYCQLLSSGLLTNVPVFAVASVLATASPFLGTRIPPKQPMPGGCLIFLVILHVFPYAYSFGVIMFELYTGESPFAGLSAKDIKFRVRCMWCEVGCNRCGTWPLDEGSVGEGT